MLPPKQHNVNSLGIAGTVIAIITMCILGGSMGLSISEIWQNTTRARHLMQRTRAQRFAVGLFNIDNQETLIAVARAAQKLQSPVLVEVSDAGS
ncbi:class II fructose-bisphosphate aldolase [Candidatus Minimicrobia naudis]